MKRFILTIILSIIPCIILADANSDFLVAAQNGNVQDIHNALLAGANINSKDVAGKNAFILAHDAATLKKLLQSPSFLNSNAKPIQCLGINNINASDNQGMTPLAHAVKDGDLDKVKILVQHGARLGGTLFLQNNESTNHKNIYDYSLEVQDNNPNGTAIHNYLIDAARERASLQTSYFDAIKNNNLNAIKAALAPQGSSNQYGGADVNGVDADGYSHLVLALGKADQTVLNFLTKEIRPFLCKNNMVAQFTQVNISNSDGKTALEHAVETGDLNAVKLLLSSGADINRLYGGVSLPQYVNNKGASDDIKYAIATAYLFDKVQNGILSELQQVLDGSLFQGLLPPVNVNEKNFSHGSTAAMVAALTGQLEKLNTLIELGADVSATVINNNRFNTLMQASLYGQSVAIGTILEKGHYSVMDVNNRNKFNQPALEAQLFGC